MSHPPVVVQVPLLGKAYNISIESGLLDDLPWPKEWDGKYSRAIVISDENVAKIYLAKLKRRFKKILPTDSIVCLPGERAKAADIANTLWQRFQTLGADRQTLVVALGGGVIGDLAGFVAATYMRGVDYLQIPTTLLAQVDSSVGGKVGINLPQGKNLVGAFWQPVAVWIDPQVLVTLGERDYRAGLAEVVKYGVILDHEFFEFIERHVLQIVARDPLVLRQIIARSCEMKRDVVLADERETTGQRALLNFGHTYGHALEQLTGYSRFLHGEAVSIGMCCAAKLAESLQLWPAESASRLEALLMILGLPTVLPNVPHDKMLAAMQADKKKANHTVQLVLPTRLGSARLVAWPGDAEVQASFARTTRSKPAP